MTTQTERSIFSNNLIRLRKQKRLSQIELADLTGLSRRMIAYYETKVVNPPLDKVEIIAKALNVGINELLGTQNIKNKSEDISKLDTRTLKKIRIIISLPKHQRQIIYSMAESFLKQNQESKK